MFRAAVGFVSSQAKMAKKTRKMLPNSEIEARVVGMLVVSFRGVNFGFWSHLGCSGQNAIIFSREGLV